MTAPVHAVHWSHGPILHTGTVTRGDTTYHRYRCLATQQPLELLLPDTLLARLRPPLDPGDVPDVHRILTNPRPRYPAHFQRRLQNARKGLADQPDAVTLARIVRIFAAATARTGKVVPSPAEVAVLGEAWRRLTTELAMAGVPNPARWVAQACPDPITHRATGLTAAAA